MRKLAVRCTARRWKALTSETRPTLAVLHRGNGSAQTLFGNLLLAVAAHAVFALLESSERGRNLLQGLPLHLDEREIDVFLDVFLGELGSWRVGRVHFPEARTLVCNSRGEFPVPLTEHLLQSDMVK